MGRRVRRTKLLIVMMSVIASVTVLACSAASASAAKVHVYSHSFGQGELALTAESGIAVNRESGEVYVADTKHSRIAKFTAAGVADGAFPGLTSPTFIAVDNSTGPSKGDVYVVEGEGTVSKLDPTGALVTSWGTGGHLSTTELILGIAVDPNGNLWVLSEHIGTVNPRGPEFGYEGGKFSGKEFDPSGASIRSWTVPFDKGLSTLIRGAGHGTAVDSADNLIVFFKSWATGSSFGVRRFGPTGNELAQVPRSSLGVLGVAIDPMDDDVYAGNLEESPNLSRVSPELKELERFGGNDEGTLPREKSAIDGLQGIASIAVDGNGAVYVADPKQGEVAVFELEEVEPPTVTMEAPDSITQTSAHVVGHINPNAPVGSPPSHEVAWEFKCVPSCPGYHGHFEADGQEHTIEATLEGLKAGWEYTVSLDAENRGGKVESVKEAFPTAPLVPGVTDEFASEVHAGEATLKAAVNPNGAATTYHFEYMTKEAFEAEGFGGSQSHSTPESEPIAALKPDPLEPAAEPPIPQVSERISGLKPATDYVYRAVATNSVGTSDGEPAFFRSQVAEHILNTDCPNQVLRTGEGARLPDCRAYELASPTEKQGSLVEPERADLQTNTDGSAVTWFTGRSASGVPAGEGGHQDTAFYLSSLASGSWSSQRLLPPESLGELAHFLGLGADGRYALLETSEHSGGAPGLYLLDAADQALTAIVPPQIGQTVEKRAFTLDGSSEDDSLFFFESPLQLTSNAAAGKDNLYLWNRETEALSVIGVLPGAKAEAPAGGSFGGAEGGSQAGLYVGAVHAISSSGDRAYFTAGETGQIYLRSGLTAAKPSTVRVSVANAGVHDANGQQPATFLEATPEGEKVFFTSPGKLTEDANTGSADEGSDLYRYDAEAKKLIDVTPLPAGAGARVQGLLGIAEDGASGYLAAKGVLAAGGAAGQNNVYHFEEGPGGAFSFKFVAALAEGRSNWSPSAAEAAKTARVSADGGTLLFMSTQSLNGGPSGKCVYGLCAEAYRYSIAEESLACVSCNPSTAAGAPLIGAELSTGFAPNLVPENWPLYGTMPRNLSSAGTRVFFETSETLLPEDRNGQNCTSQQRCGDVYEWEAVGTPGGSCQVAEANGGCLYLISGGESGESSYFLDASANGDSAFFITASELVPADKDELSDVYDARVDGGLASQHVIPSESCRSAEACDGAGTSPPPPPSAGTQSFQGPGNPPVTRCKQGSARKHARCVKRHRPKRHKARKHHQRKRRATGKKRAGGRK